MYKSRHKFWQIKLGYSTRLWSEVVRYATTLVRIATHFKPFEKRREAEYIDNFEFLHTQNLLTSITFIVTMFQQYKRLNMCQNSNKDDQLHIECIKLKYKMYTT